MYLVNKSRHHVCCSKDIGFEIPLCNNQKYETRNVDITLLYS